MQEWRREIRAAPERAQKMEFRMPDLLERAYLASERVREGVEAKRAAAQRPAEPTVLGGEIKGASGGSGDPELLLEC